MNTAVEQTAPSIEHALITKNLAGLSVDQRLEYYNEVCESLGLNPLTQPFDFIVLNNKLTLYAKKDATEQLRKIHRVSITALDNVITEGIVIFTAYAKDSNQRTDVATGAVSIDGLKGENRANAIMKAETKAKRRVTLSICGLGMLDETEIGDVPQVTSMESQAPALVEVPPMNEAPAQQGMKLSPEGSRQFVDLVLNPPEPNAALREAAAVHLDKHPTHKPTKEQLDAYKERTAKARTQLEDAGFQPSKGSTTGAKLVKYFTRIAGVDTPKEMTVGTWEGVFQALDILMKNPKQAVERIEEVIK